jgi:hypothetical protein
LHLLASSSEVGICGTHTFWHAGFENEQVQQVDGSGQDGQLTQCRDFFGESQDFIEPGGNCRPIGAGYNGRLLEPQVI